MSKFKENDYMLYVDKYIFLIISISDEFIYSTKYVALIRDDNLLLWDGGIHFFDDRHMIDCKKLPTAILNQYLKIVTFQ